MTRSIRLIDLLMLNKNKVVVQKYDHMMRDLLLAILKRNRPIKEKSYAVQCLGHFSNDNGYILRDVLNEYCKAWQPVCFRIACIHAIESSQILLKVI